MLQKKSMDTLKIRLEPSILGLHRAKAGFISLLLANICFTSVNADELSLENRLKEFNQPTVVASVSKEVTAQPSAIKKTVTKRSKLKRACYQSSAAAIRKTAENFQPHIRANSRRYSVEEALILSVITAESCFIQRARSHKGAQGLMQLIPATAKRFGVRDSYLPSQNIQGGTRYLRFLMKRFSGNMRYAVAAYNAGEGAVDRYGGIPPYRETQEYVRRVMAVYNRLKGNHAAPIPSRAATVKQAVLARSSTQKKRGNFIKPDYKWKRKPGKAVRVSRTYQTVKHAAGKQVCRDTTSKSIRRTTDLIKRTTLWRRHYTVTKSVPLSSIARSTGVSLNELLRLNRGISRLSVKSGRKVLIWQCSTR